MTAPTAAASSLSPFDEIPREKWAQLSAETPLPLTAQDIARVAGTGDAIDLHEADAIYRPISRLLAMHVQGAQDLRRSRSEFFHTRFQRTPYVIGIGGSVAVGKSTTARLLRELTARWPDTPRVQLVTTDGFLHPNAVLEQRGIMHRKGFPESFDRRALLRFIAEVKAGAERVEAPVYSHLTYDIVPDQRVIVERPDVLILEGINVLQGSRARRDGLPGLAVSDYFDFSVYVDAKPEDIRRWYIDRFLTLRSTAFQSPRSYFRRYAELDDEAARAKAGQIWDGINGPNLQQNVLPTRGRANLVLRKAGDHRVHSVLLRKL